MTTLSAPPGRVPRHVAIIMDGNGRWARARGLPRIAGHRRGGEAVRRTVAAASEIGIAYLTLYGFSSENWNRPAREITDLMSLLRHYLQREIDSLNKNGIRLRVIGDRNRFAPDIVGLIEQAEALTRENGGINLTVALSYGARAEIVAAVRAITKKAADGRLLPAEITETAVAEHLFTAGIPDPDLLVRTSGEQRISNFLLWQCAYAEFVFTKTLWPDFSKADLLAAVEEYTRRERRYGTFAEARV